ncbi:hypothetical protein [Nocardiopsis kunsanensis]|nr:hypothetical protein [Nocardiopsis kunsanensis]
MVIDVLCAYLRMPYTPRPDAPSEQPGQPVPPSASPTTVIDLSWLRSTEPDDVQREKQQAAREEHRRRVLEFASFREVRHTIIRIIGNHLRENTRWRGKDYDFTGAVFDGGHLVGAHFTGGRVPFNGAVFSGGTVDLSAASGACPGGLLEAMERGEQGVVGLPEHWRPANDENGQQEDPSASPDASDR